MEPSNPPDFPKRIFEVYTDGSYSSKTKRGGFAYVYTFRGKLYAKHGSQDDGLVLMDLAPRANTNSVGELLAVALFLRDAHRYIRAGLSSEPGKNYELNIHSDSEYLVKSFNEYIKAWKMKGWKRAGGKPIAHVDLIRKMDSDLEGLRALGCQVTIRHVRAHCGIEMNEMADTLCSRYIL